MENKTLVQQVEELQKTIDEMNNFIMDSFDKLLNKKKTETPKKNAPVEEWKKNFDEALEYYNFNFENKLNDKLFCTYVPKKNTIECCGKEARYVLFGNAEERTVVSIDPNIYKSIVETYGLDANQSFGKFRCSSCKSKALKDSLSKCEELIGKKGQTDQIHESASSPKTRKSATRRTTPTKVISPKNKEYTDTVIQLDDGTNIVKRKIKGSRIPAFIIGKLESGINEDYIDNLVKPTDEEIKKSGLNYKEIIKEEVIVVNNTEDDVDVDEDDDADEDDEVQNLVKNLN